MNSPRFVAVVLMIGMSRTGPLLPAQTAQTPSRSNAAPANSPAETKSPTNTNAALPATSAAAPKHHIVVISQRSIRAKLHLDAETMLTPKEWFLYSPQPPELPSQINITAKLLPGGKPARELSPQRRAILSARIKAGSSPAHRIQVDVEYTMTLLARSLVARRESDPASKTEPLPDSQRSQWLVTSPLCDYREREFQKWLDDAALRRGPDESVVDFARRVFQHIRSEFTYEFLTDLDRRATFICRDRKSDCMGLSVLFVSIMRANLVPARILVGRWAQSSVAGDTLGGLPYTKEHVKCEFHAPDVGWVPVDLASALLHEREHVATRFFGMETADFVTLHVNDNLIVHAGAIGRRTLPFLQDVSVWVIGQGKSSDLKVTKQWHVEAIGR